MNGPQNWRIGTTCYASEKLFGAEKGWKEHTGFDHG